jgi:hypothetical protein
MAGRHWSDEELATLRQLYPDTPSADIAQRLGRTLAQVYSKAGALKLRKSAEYLASPDACRLRRGDEVGKEHRFAPGQRPWNAGLKGWSAGGNSIKGRFQPGERPHTWQPVGAERVTTEGYLQRKMTDTGYSPRDWVNVHHLLWQEHHGPIPDGHIIVFKNGDKSDVRLENLELLTRGENMRRNSLHTRYPKEIGQLIQLKGALQRQINKRSKA